MFSNLIYLEMMKKYDKSAAMQISTVYEVTFSIVLPLKLVFIRPIWRFSIKVTTSC